MHCKKYNLFSILVLISSVLFAQSSPIKIKLLELGTNNPVSDVTIIIDDTIIGYTDINGTFLLKENHNNIHEISFIHISYESKSLSIEKLKTIPFVYLESKADELDEVLLVTSKSISIKEIVKNSVKAFEGNFKEEPHLADTNLKQLVSLNDSLPSFIEIDGDMILLGKNKDIWSHPILIPRQVRRTKENYNSKPDRKEFSHSGINLFVDPFKTIFRFFELRHPLSKRGNKLYDFQLEEIVTVGNKDFYVINYYSKEDNLKIIGRDFHSINGQLIIQEENFGIKKTTALFRRGKESVINGHDVIFTIDYSLINDNIYYDRIAYNINSFSTFKKKKNSIVLKGLLTFSHQNKNYQINFNKKLFSNRQLFVPFKTFNTYNKDHWNDKTLVCCGFEDDLKLLFKSYDHDIIFQKGSKQIINLSSKEDYTKIQEKEILDLIDSKIP